MESTVTRTVNIDRGQLVSVLLLLVFGVGAGLWRGYYHHNGVDVFEVVVFALITLALFKAFAFALIAFTAPYEERGEKTRKVAYGVFALWLAFLLGNLVGYSYFKL